MGIKQFYTLVVCCKCLVKGQDNAKGQEWSLLGVPSSRAGIVSAWRWASESLSDVGRCLVHSFIAQQHAVLLFAHLNMNTQNRLPKSSGESPGVKFVSFFWSAYGLR